CAAAGGAAGGRAYEAGRGGPRLTPEGAGARRAVHAHVDGLDGGEAAARRSEVDRRIGAVLEAGHREVAAGVGAAAAAAVAEGDLYALEGRAAGGLHVTRQRLGGGACSEDCTEGEFGGDGHAALRGTGFA